MPKYLKRVKVVEFEFYGIVFKGLEYENGEVIYSARQFAKQSQIPVSTFLEKRKELSIEGTKKITWSLQGNENKYPTVSGATVANLSDLVIDNNKNQCLYDSLPITKEEIIAWLILFADMGNPKWQAVRDSGLAILFQMEEDKATGRERSVDEYRELSQTLQKSMHEFREKLRNMSGEMTNKYLACHVYTPNNNFIYGEGFNRNTYDKPDAALKHRLSEIAEMMEVGAKIHGIPLKDCIEKTHEVLAERYPGIVRSPLKVD